MRFVSLLVLCTFLTACAAEPAATRSTRPPDGGNGDGDGDGDTGDGDGDGDTGDGDGDGDDETVGGLVPIDSVVVPIPQGANPDNSRIVDLNNDGHVLIYASIGDEPRVPLVWRGGAAAAERIALPAGYEDAQILCFLDDDRLVLELPYDDADEFPRTALVEGNAVTVMEAPIPQSTFDFLRFIRCNNAGQVLARSAEVWWLIGPAAPTRIEIANATEGFGLNESGVAFFDNGYWDGTEVKPLKADFKAYDGLSNDGVMLGSWEELKQMTHTYAALWDPRDDSVMVLPGIGGTLEVAEPVMMGPNGDVVVGTGIFGEEPNILYLWRDGKYARLGTVDEDFDAVRRVNDKGQVLLDPPFFANDHLGILFTPRN